jgi:hypothetical protein
MKKKSFQAFRLFWQESQIKIIRLWNTALIYTPIAEFYHAACVKRRNTTLISETKDTNSLKAGIKKCWKLKYFAICFSKTLASLGITVICAVYLYLHWNSVALSILPAIFWVGRYKSEIYLKAPKLCLDLWIMAPCIFVVLLLHW